MKNKCSQQMHEVATAAASQGFYSPYQRQWMRENGGLPWPPYALSELPVLWDEEAGRYRPFGERVYPDTERKPK